MKMPYAASKLIQLFNDVWEKLKGDEEEHSLQHVFIIPAASLLFWSWCMSLHSVM